MVRKFLQEVKIIISILIGIQYFLVVWSIPIFLKALLSKGQVCFLHEENAVKLIDDRSVSDKILRLVPLATAAVNID